MTDEPLLRIGATRAQKILDQRLAASQAASVAEAVEALQQVVAAATTENAGTQELDALEAALH